MDIVTGVGVLDKAMAVVRSVATEPKALAQLQESTGYPRATVHRLATALEAHGLLRRTDPGVFELGPELVSLGRRARDRYPVVERARPILSALRDDTGESVQLFVREGDQRRCAISLETPHGLRWIVPEGALFPLSLGSAGRILSDDDPVCDAAGWIQSVGEREAGVASVSAPVRSASGATVAAVSVSGPIERLTAEPGSIFGAAVVAAAAAVSAVFTDPGR